MDRNKAFRGRTLSANNYTDDDKKAVEALKNGGTPSNPAYSKAEIDSKIAALEARIAKLENPTT